jgi:hypothetical protein
LYYLNLLLFTDPVWRWVRILPCKSMKREPGAWAYNWATLSLGDKYTETWSSRLGGWVGLWPCSEKKKTVVTSKEVKTGSNLAELSKEGYGSKTAVLMIIFLFMHHLWMITSFWPRMKTIYSTQDTIWIINQHNFPLR